MSWYSSTSVFVIRQGNKGGFLVAVKGMFHFLKDCGMAKNGMIFTRSM